MCYCVVLCQACFFVVPFFHEHVCGVSLVDSELSLKLENCAFQLCSCCQDDGNSSFSLFAQAAMLVALVAAVHRRSGKGSCSFTLTGVSTGQVSA